MKITLLGQAGVLLERGGVQIMVDPYLSDSVGKINPENYRRIPADERYFEITPDVMIFTHSHLDHYDPETAPRFLEKRDKRMTVLAPTSVWNDARSHGHHNYVLFDRHTQWSCHGLRFTAVKAAHSDPHAIGVVIEDEVEDKTCYITGDTLYSSDIFADLPEKIDVVFLPINGVGNNMNVRDAERFAVRTGAKHAVPLHFGLFDDMDGTEFTHFGRILAKAYETVEV